MAKKAEKPASPEKGKKKEKEYVHPWGEIFQKRIWKEKITNVHIMGLMGLSEPAFYDGITSGSFKFLNLLKIYKLYDWDLNELKSDDRNIVNDPNTHYNRLASTEQNNSQQLENIQRIYDAHIESLKGEIYTLKGQINFLQKVIEKDYGISGGAVSNGG